MAAIRRFHGWLDANEGIKLATLFLLLPLIVVGTQFRSPWSPIAWAIFLPFLATRTWCVFVPRRRGGKP
jgi:hypothetical protein